MAIEDVAKPLLKIAFDKWVKSAVTGWLATLPGFLGAGPIGWFLGYVAGQFAEFLFEWGGEWMDWGAILLRNNTNRRVFDDHSVKLKIIAQGAGIESEEFKKASQEHAEKFSAFIKYHHGR